jgi:hypothetical protein
VDEGLVPRPDRQLADDFLAYRRVANAHDRAVGCWVERRLRPHGDAEELTRLVHFVGLVKCGDAIAATEIVQEARDLSREASRPEDRDGIIHRCSP